MAESCLAALKPDLLLPSDLATRAVAIRDVAAWIEAGYNRRRRHSSIEHLTPVNFEMKHLSPAADIQLAA